MWTITNLKKVDNFMGYNQVVIMVKVMYEVTINGKSEYWRHQYYLRQDNITNFIPFEQLTEELIWSWITDPNCTLLADHLNKADIERQVREAVELKQAPMSAANMATPPWVN